MSTVALGLASGRSTWLAIALRVVVAALLVVDAVVHLRLSSQYEGAFAGGIGGGNLFRIEAAVAIIAALYVLARGSKLSYVVAFVVAASAFAAVVLYRYVDVPALGPIPSMYEPLWFFEKSLTAVAEGAAAVLAAVGIRQSGPAAVGAADEGD